MNIADECVFNLVNESPHLAEHGLTRTLDSLYDRASVNGLNSASIHTLVEYLLSSEILGVETKVYLIKHCLIPREYINCDTIRLIVRRLGTPTVFDPYKMTIPKSLQSALVFWVFHIYPWVKPSDVFNNDFSRWFESWKFDYLQHWITYILVWSFNSGHITKWRCKVLYEVGINPAYRDSNTYSAFLLKAFLSSCNSTMRPHIEELLNKLNANERKMKTFGSYNYDKGFVKKMKQAQIHAGIIGAQKLETVWKAYFQYQEEIGEFESPQSLETEHLAKYWENYELPYDIHFILKDSKSSNWLVLAALPLENQRITSLLEYLKYSSNSRKLINKYPLLRMLDYELGFKLGYSLMLSSDKNISSFLERLEESSSEHSAYKLIMDEITSLYLCHKLNPKYARASDLLSYLLMHFVDKMLRSKSEDIKMIICSILLICSSIEDPNLMCFIHVFETRTLEQILAIGDPLLYSYLCRCLNCTKRHLSINDEQLVAEFDQVIQFTINYLWESNKLISNNSIVPSRFWKTLAANQHLTQASVPSRVLFPIPNIFCLQNTFHRLLLIEENKNNLDHYNNKFTESGFREWKARLKKEESLNWFRNIENFSEFRLFLLEKLEQDGRYSPITNFILTFDKKE